MTLQTGLKGSAELTVTQADTAAAVGSGDVPVLATPRLLALLEAATLAAVRTSLDEPRTSVGTRVQVEHLRPSAVGEKIAARAELSYLDGRLLRFTVAAEDSQGRLVANGEITRVVVDRKRFLARV